jgi:hypothetical protein
MTLSKGKLSGAISLGCFLVVQTIVVVWWASTLTANVRYMSTDIIQLRQAVKEHTVEQGSAMATFLDRGITNATGVAALKERCVIFEQRLQDLEKRVNAKNGP